MTGRRTYRCYNRVFQFLSECIPVMALSRPIFFGPSETDDCWFEESLFAFNLKLKNEVSGRGFVSKLMQNHNLIDNNWNCERCGQQCQLDNIRFVWRCQKKVSIRRQAARRCNSSKSAFKGEWFEQAHVKPADNLQFCQIYLDKLSFSVPFVKREIGWSGGTIVDWASFIREVLESYIAATTNKIGGVEFHVEIDESKFGRTKYHRGRFTTGQWVFGGYCRETEEFFAVPVDRRDSATLLQVIKDRIAPGTTIISDCWAAYNCLSQEGYIHLTVNHTYNFVDPITGAHTNTIERLWRSIKESFSRNGCRKHHYRGYLARFYFLKTYPTLKQRMHTFFIATALLYPPQVDGPPQPPQV
ncbi:unnamed protein product [Meganyctiphanes norvegica]|uniref:ISXO2-like transposase domain-containing protein n=1 Tax=Meganyctiphanes norvegica TaxID=48144 RepID=A0AAV2R7W4_MEGNR